MISRLKERVNQARNKLAKIILPEEFDIRKRMYGEIWYKLEKPGESNPLIYLGKNVITNDASIFVARLIKDPAEPTAGGFALAVGTGDVGWDLQNVPAASATQGSLYNELDRKQFSLIEFIDGGGLSSLIPTHVLDFTCTYGAADAVGPLVEMGIVCAPTDITPPLTPNPIAQVDWNDPLIDRTAFDTFLNVRNFNVINKPAGMTLTFVWRVSF